MTINNAEEAYEHIVKSLPADEQLRLVERIAHHLAMTQGDSAPEKRYD